MLVAPRHNVGISHSYLENIFPGLSLRHFHTIKRSTISKHSLKDNIQESSAEIGRTYKFG